MKTRKIDMDIAAALGWTSVREEVVTSTSGRRELMLLGRPPGRTGRQLAALPRFETDEGAAWLAVEHLRKSFDIQVSYFASMGAYVCSVRSRVDGSCVAEESHETSASMAICQAAMAVMANQTTDP